MRVLIVHYHLKPGGVSTVIRRQVSVLKALGVDVSVLVGEAPGAGTSFPVVIEPALAYDPEVPPGSVSGQVGERRGGGQGGETGYGGEDGKKGTGDPRLEAIVAAVENASGSSADDTIVHVHNPTLCKNSALLPALSVLTAKGYPLVLHVHDLAEDWRPDVYSRVDYPQPATWVCINQRDVRNLKAAGARQVFFLPNAAFGGEPGSEGSGERDGVEGGTAGNLILYPVRGIRRKNLGEAVLLSLFLPSGLSLGITLPPNNPKDLPYYNGWKAAVSAFKAPAGFELGLAADFDELYRQARAVVSTSIKEGFGLSFLEPLARGKAVLGRRLSAVVDDFEESGLRFPGLYRHISVPDGCFDLDTFLNRVKQVVMAAASAYGIDGASLAETIAGSFSGNPDFGRLDETAQAETLSRLAADPGAKAAFLAANPFLESWWEPRGAPVAPEDLKPWSEDSYGVRLAALYQAVKETGGGSPPDKNALLAVYLNPEGFHGVGL
ncbi:MAG: glycosyltransferase [Clostridia bacterium]|jgi:hypothetical protein